MDQGSDFKSATTEQLEKILERLDKADAHALDYIHSWVAGNWNPECSGGNHINWLISWLDMQETYLNNGR
jgi:hypothetical protein